MSISLLCIPAGLGFPAEQWEDRSPAAGGKSEEVGDGSPRFTRDCMIPPPEARPPDERPCMDALLIQRMAEGDKEALAELYRRFSGPLYGVALRILRDAGDAQDIVHDVFVTLWQKAATFETTRGTAFSWATTLVRNRAIDRVRMRQRRGELLAASASADLGYGDDQLPPAADTAAALGDDAQAVRAAVATLPADQQLALQLAYFGGLTQEEIARKLAEPLGTVKARIRRGLLKLRDLLASKL